MKGDEITTLSKYKRVNNNIVLIRASGEEDIKGFTLIGPDIAKGETLGQLKKEASGYNEEINEFIQQLINKHGYEVTPEEFIQSESCTY